MYNIPSTEAKSAVDNGDEEDVFSAGASVRVAATPASQYRSLYHSEKPTTPTKRKASGIDSLGVDFLKNNASVTLVLLGVLFMVLGFMIATTSMSIMKAGNVATASKANNSVFMTNANGRVVAPGDTQLRHFKQPRKEFTASAPKADTPFLCSITRVRNEHTKFKSFIKHQLQEGFDLLLFLDDRSYPPLHSDEPRVRIRQVDFSILAEMNRQAGYRVVNPYGLSFVKQYVQSELMSCTWVAYVDVDEFVTTRRNENKTVRDELNDSFSHVDSVHVPWIFYGNELANAPPVRDDLTLEILWRQNHSLHHEGYDRKTRDRYHEIGAFRVLCVCVCVCVYAAAFAQSGVGFVWPLHGCHHTADMSVLFLFMYNAKSRRLTHTNASPCSLSLSLPLNVCFDCIACKHVWPPNTEHSLYRDKGDFPTEAVHNGE